MRGANIHLLSHVAGLSFLSSLVAHTAKVLVLPVFDRRPLVKRFCMGSFSHNGNICSPNAIARSL